MKYRPSCLVLHGYGGAPFDVSFLTQALSEHGLRVSSPCLPGHGQSREAFAKSRFSDWMQAADEHLQKLMECGPCVVIGLSMGGSLALALAEKYTLAGVVTIAAPVFLYSLVPWRGASKLLPMVPLLRFVRPIVHLSRPEEQIKKIAPSAGYEGFQALQPLHSFIRGLRPIYRNLHRVRAPLLILHSPQDQTVPVDNAWQIMMRVASDMRRMELLSIQETQTNRHLLTSHVETKVAVQEAVLRFVMQREVLGAV